MEWIVKFWNTHGERLIFATLALSLAAVMRYITLEAESNTIIIGIAMLFFNKTRGTNGGSKNEPV